MSDTPDHYEVLGVPRDASTGDIERARKRLALIWHPDRNQSADAAQHFDEMQKAAEVLRDPVARAAYDRDFALRAAMSIPHDLRDRRPSEPPPEFAYTTPPPRAPADTAPADTAAASTGPAHTRPKRRRRRRLRSRVSQKGRIWAGLVVLIGVAVGITAAFLTGLGRPAPAVPRPAAGPAQPSASGGTPHGTARGTGTFPLPQYTPGQAVLPVNQSRVLSIGRSITLLAVGGHVVWQETAGLSSLDTNLASSGGPHARHGCVVDGNRSGHRYDFISHSGRQVIVTEDQPPAAGSMALTSNRVALPDGTIRNLCTGAVVDRAAPSGTFTTAECLTGSILIGTDRRDQMAWQNGHKLWQRQTRDPLVCDGHGSVVKLNPATHKISLIDPLNGQPLWTANDPGCPHNCISSSGSPVQVLGSGSAVLLSDADQVLALARGNGRLLWRKPSRCALAARTGPSPEVLLGSCPGQVATTGATNAKTVTAATGAVIATDAASGNGCGPGGQWAASSHQLLIICPGPSTGQRGYQAQLINW